VIYMDPKLKKQLNREQLARSFDADFDAWCTAVRKKQRSRVTPGQKISYWRNQLIDTVMRYCYKR
jgi:hypothetical protein